MLLAEPKASEAKPPFSTLPSQLVSQIENILQSKIISGNVFYGSIGASATFKVKTADNRCFFLKGTHPNEKAHGVKIIRQEYDFLKNHHAMHSLTAKLYGLVSDDGEDGWTLMVSEFLDKKSPLPPWTDEKIKAVFSTIKTYQSFSFDDLHPITTHNIWGPLLRGDILNWHKILHRNELFEGFLSLFADQDKAKAWLSQLTPHLLADEQKQTTLKADGLMHGDLRSDNIILTSDGVKIIDWPDGIFGIKALDVISFVHGVSAEWLKSPHDLYLLYDPAPNLDTVKIINSMLSGLYARQAWRPVPSVMPRLRWMQKMQLYPALFWLSQLHKLDPPPPFQEMTACY